MFLIADFKQWSGKFVTFYLFLSNNLCFVIKRYLHDGELNDEFSVKIPSLTKSIKIGLRRKHFGKEAHYFCFC